MNCEELKSSLLEWFGRELECRPDERDGLIVDLPIQAPNGDFIEVGIQPMDAHDSWRVSDLGETHRTLFLAGIDLEEESTRTDEFRRIVADSNMFDQDGELWRVVSGDLPDSIFDFVSGLNLALGIELTIQAKQTIKDFDGQVATLFKEAGASFEIPTRRIEGSAGSWKFNFSLNHVRPQTLVKTISVSSKTHAMQVSKGDVFEIQDVRKKLPMINAIAIVDDRGERRTFWNDRLLRIFTEYEIPVYPFNENRNGLVELARSYAG